MIAATGLTTPATGGQPGKPEISAQTMRSGGEVDPEQRKLTLDHADLAFDVDPARETLAGIATLTLRTSGEIDRLLLDLDPNLAVSAIAIDGRAIAASAWDDPDGRLTIRLPAPAPAGATVTARITYAGTPHVAVRAPWDDGMVWSHTADGQPWVATSAQGYGCDLYWPCIDNPAGEVGSATIHITVPKGLSAISNGAAAGTAELPDGRTTWSWRSGSINPYLIAINVGPFVAITDTYHSRFGNKFPMTFWALPEHAAQARHLFETEFAPMIDFFESQIGPYPFADQKMGVIEAPFLGMEHQTVNAYGNGFKPAPEGFDWVLQHEFAHEWFGNQMTAANWDDFWLHEGFAQYMQPLYGRWREGEARYAIMMAEQRMQITDDVPIVSKRTLTSEEVYEPEQGGPGTDIYYKGSWVLHTLRNLIGDKAFFAATRRLVYGRSDPMPGNFKPRLADTAEFQRLIDEESGQDLGWFFDVYVYDSALPELIETRSGDVLKLKWQVSEDKPFPMPVEVSVDGVVQTVAMPDGSARLTIPAAAHVVLDPWARILRRDVALDRVKQKAG